MTYAKRKTGKRIRPDFKPWQSVEFIGWRKGKDNRGYYNSNSSQCDNRNSMRIPPLNASDKIWNGFYRLFPHVKRFLMGDRTAWYGTFGEVTYDEKTRTFTVRKERNTGVRCMRTLKLRKSW